MTRYKIFTGWNCPQRWSAEPVYLQHNNFPSSWELCLLRFQYNKWFKSGITKCGISSAQSGYFYYAIHIVISFSLDIIVRKPLFSRNVGRPLQAFSYDAEPADLSNIVSWSIHDGKSSSKKLLVFSCLLERLINTRNSQGGGFDVYQRWAY